MDQVSKAAKPSLKGSGKAQAPDEESPGLLSSAVRLTQLQQRSLLWSWKRVRVGGPVGGRRGSAAYARQLVQTRLERDGGVEMQEWRMGRAA